MTTEERFQKIENALQHSVEIQAEHAESVRELREMQKGLVIVLNKMAAENKEAFKLANETINAYFEALKETEGRIMQLIETEIRNRRKE